MEWWSVGVLESWSDGVVEWWRIWILASGPEGPHGPTPRRDWGIRVEKDEERRRVKTKITNHKTQITNKSQ